MLGRFLGLCWEAFRQFIGRLMEETSPVKPIRIMYNRTQACQTPSLLLDGLQSVCIVVGIRSLGYKTTKPSYLDSLAIANIYSCKFDYLRAPRIKGVGGRSPTREIIEIHTTPPDTTQFVDWCYLTQVRFLNQVPYGLLKKLPTQSTKPSQHVPEASPKTSEHFQQNPLCLFGRSCRKTYNRTPNANPLLNMCQWCFASF